MAKKRAQPKSNGQPPAAKRPRTEDELAAVFKVSGRTVRNWKNAAWWEPEFKTAAGYDVEAIKAAAPHLDPELAKERREAQRLRNQIRLRRERAEMEIKMLEQKKRERAQALELGQTLPADVYAEFIREVLGMIRAGIEELPQRFAKELPTKYRRLAYVDPKKAKRAKDRGILQRYCEEILDDVAAWLATDPTEETEK